MNRDDKETVKDEIQTAVRRLAIATVLVYLALVGLGIYIYVDSANRRADLAEKAAETTTALCALRHDLEVRVASSEAFLEDNPDGIPGLSADVIRQGIANQRSTIEALSPLECNT